MMSGRFRGALRRRARPGACSRPSCSDPTERTPGGSVRRALAIAAMVGLIGCGSDPVAPGGCPPGAEQHGDLCWAHLGLESAWVSAIAATPWGTFAGAQTGDLFRLETNDHWTPLGPAVWRDRMVLRALLYVPADPPRLFAGFQFYNGPGDTARSALYTTHDRGETWTPQDRELYGQAPPQWQLAIFDLAVDPRDPHRLFMSGIDGVLRSLDSGQTWDFVVGEFKLITNGFVDLLIDPHQPDRMWVAGQGGYFVPSVGVSYDGGTTWAGTAPQCAGRIYQTAVSSLAMAPGIPDRLFLGADLGLFQSDEAGADGSWNCPGGIAGAVAGFAEMGDALYAATVFIDLIHEPGGDIREETELGFYRTRDNGESWDSLAVPETAVGAASMVGDPVANRTLVGTRQGLWAVTPLSEFRP
jgi:hypothetical protein